MSDSCSHQVSHALPGALTTHIFGVRSKTGCSSTFARTPSKNTDANRGRWSTSTWGASTWGTSTRGHRHPGTQAPEAQATGAQAPWGDLGKGAHWTSSRVRAFHTRMAASPPPLTTKAVHRAMALTLQQWPSSAEVTAVGSVTTGRLCTAPSRSSSVQSVSLFLFGTERHSGTAPRAHGEECYRGCTASSI